MQRALSMWGGVQVPAFGQAALASRLFSKKGGGVVAGQARCFRRQQGPGNGWDCK